MLPGLSVPLKVLAPYGILIYVLGVAVRYGAGSGLGTALAAIGVAVFLFNEDQRNARPHP